MPVAGGARGLLRAAAAWSSLPLEAQQRRLRAEADDRSSATNRFFAVLCIMGVFAATIATTICMELERRRRQRGHSQVTGCDFPADEVEPVSPPRARPARPPRPCTPEGKPVSFASYLQEFSSPKSYAPQLFKPERLKSERPKPEPRKLLVRERMYPRRPATAPAPLGGESEVPAGGKAIESPSASAWRAPPATDRPSSAPISPGARFRHDERPTSAPGLSSSRRRDEDVGRHRTGSHASRFRETRQQDWCRGPSPAAPDQRRVPGPYPPDARSRPQPPAQARGLADPRPQTAPGATRQPAPGGARPQTTDPARREKPRSPKSPKQSGSPGSPCGKAGAAEEAHSRQSRHSRLWGSREPAPEAKPRWSLWSLFGRASSAPEVMPPLPPPLDPADRPPAAHAAVLIADMLEKLEETRERPLRVRKDVFRELQKQLHPDKNREDPEGSKLAFQQLMEQRRWYLARPLPS